MFTPVYAFVLTTRPTPRFTQAGLDLYAEGLPVLEGPNARSPLQWTYFVCTTVWLLLNTYTVLQLVDALRHLPGRKLVPWFHDFVLVATKWVVLSSFSRAITCGPFASGHGDPASPTYYRNEKLRWGWVMPLCVQLGVRFISPASVWRVRQVISKWGVIKKIH